MNIELQKIFGRLLAQQAGYPVVAADRNHSSLIRVKHAVCTGLRVGEEYHG